MAHDFETNGHKNLELLRFYINKDISQIDKKISSNNIQFIGYLFASLVDILIVLIFDDYLTTSISSVLGRILIVLCLIVLFALLSAAVKKIIGWYDQRRKTLGKSAYLSEEIQKMIDNFDNIACDGLLICEAYCHRYEHTSHAYLQDFYLYEIIHHLQKSLSICLEVCANQKLYISADERDKIDVYRIINFIEFSAVLVDFLHAKLDGRELDADLKKDLNNLDIDLEKLKKHQ